MGTDRLTLTVEEARALMDARPLAYEHVSRDEIPSLHLGRRVVVRVHAPERLVQHVGTDVTA